MTAPDRKKVELLLERAWQIAPSGREAFVRSEAGSDQALLEAVLARLGDSASDAAGAVDLDATIDLPAGIDLDAPVPSR